MGKVIGSGNICIAKITDGYSNAVITLYRSAESALKPLRMLYNFSSGELSSGTEGKTLAECLNGWSLERDSTSHYAISASVRSTEEYGSIESSAWGDIFSVSEKGETVVSVVLYQRAENTPEKPTGDIIYNFYTGAVSGALGAWSASIPDYTEYPLWSISATASAVLSDSTTTDTISASEWSESKKIAENGESAVEIHLSAYSYVFPADEDGIVTDEEYAKFSVEVLAVRGGKSVDFTMAASATGISDISVSGNTVKASSSSRMTSDSASVKLSIVAEGETYTKVISIAKAKQSKPTTLYFAWSKSETIFSPESSNFWIMGTSFIYFNNSLIGNIPFTSTWVSNWSEIESRKTEEYCYLWCKTSESGTPFLFTGATGKTGACTLYQYYASTSSETQAGASWVDDMPSIAGGKYLWMRTKSVPAGGVAGDYAWGTPVLAGTDISYLMASIEDTNEQLTQNMASIVANSKAIEAKVEQTTYDEKVTTLESDIKAVPGKIALQVSENGDITDNNGTKLAGITITKDGIELDGATVIKNGSLTAGQINATEFFKGKTFIVDTDGAIESTNYVYGKSGFHLGDDGVLKAMGADLVNAKVSGDAEFTGRVVTTAIETVNQEGTEKVTYDQTLGTAYYKKQLINDEIDKIAENTAESETSATQFSMTYGGVSYTTPRKFTSHQEATGGGISMKTPSSPTVSGGYVYVTATNTITTSGNRKFKFNRSKEGKLSINYHIDSHYEETWVPATYTYSWVVESVETLTGTAPEDTGFPSNPSVGTVHVSYAQITPKKYTATTHVYSKIVATEGHWEQEYIDAEDGTTAMTLAETSITLDGTATSFDAWISAGTVVITEKWRVGNSYTSYSSPFWNGTTSTYSYSYSYSRYYGLGVFFGSTQWTPLTDGMSDTNVTIYRGGTLRLQAGDGSPTWTGATKYYKFSHSLDVGSWPVSNGKWNGSTVTGGTLSISSSAVSYGGNTWNVGAYYTQSTYLPSFLLLILTKPLGCHITGGVYPPEGTGTAMLGTATRTYKELYVEDIKCNGSIVGETFTGKTTGYHDGDVNSADTTNKVYGAKFTGTPLYGPATVTGTVNLREAVTKYEWITIFWRKTDEYYCTPATFHSSMYSLYSSSAMRLVLSTDSKYVSVYFPSADTLTVVDSNVTAYITVIGYK